MKWLVFGYYGLGNFGDDLMLYLLLESICRSDRRADFVIGMARHGRSTAIAIPPHCNVRYFSQSMLLRHAGFFLRARKVVLGGGTCVHAGGAGWWRTNLLAALLGRRPLWVGVGIEPVTQRSRRLKAKIAARCAKRIAVRDRYSLSSLGELIPRGAKAELTADLAYLLPDSSLMPGTAQSETATLVIVWRDFRGLGLALSENCRDNIISAAVELAENNRISEIVVANHCASLDESACGDLYRGLTAATASKSIQVTYDDDSTLTRSLMVLNRAALVLSARMHGFVVSKILGRPAVGISYAQKTAAAAREFPGKPYVSPEALAVSGADLVQAARREFVASKQSDRVVQRLRARALRNIQIIEEA